MRLTAAIALSLLLAACGGGGGPEPEQETAQPAPDTIGARGGVQASVNGLGLHQ